MWPSDATLWYGVSELLKLKHIYSSTFGLLQLKSLRWMPNDSKDDKLTLVPVAAECWHATSSDYLNQCWSSSMSLYAMTRGQQGNSCNSFIIYQAGKLNFFGTRPNWAVSYIAYTKFHLPRPVFHSPDQIFTRIGKRASPSFPACIPHKVEQNDDLVYVFECVMCQGVWCASNRLYSIHLFSFDLDEWKQNKNKTKQKNQADHWRVPRPLNKVPRAIIMTVGMPMWPWWAYNHGGTHLQAKAVPINLIWCESAQWSTTSSVHKIPRAFFTTVGTPI